MRFVLLRVVFIPAKLMANNGHPIQHYEVPIGLSGRFFKIQRLTRVKQTGD